MKRTDGGYQNVVEVVEVVVAVEVMVLVVIA